jgi:hypothetical protein
VERNGLGLVDQPDALGKLAPYDQHGVLGQRFWVILAHGNSPLAVAMSLLDQGSVVKVQFCQRQLDLPMATIRNTQRSVYTGSHTPWNRVRWEHFHHVQNEVLNGTPPKGI